LTSENQENRFQFGDFLLQNEVVGFDENDNKIVKKRQSQTHPSSSLVREYPRPLKSGHSVPRNTGGLTKLTIGLRKIPIREDYTKYPSTVKVESPIFSDYDDTDLNPNIKVVYANRKKQRTPPSKKIFGNKNFKKIDSQNKTNTYEDTIEYEYEKHQQTTTESNKDNLTDPVIDYYEDEVTTIKDIDTKISKMDMQCLLAIVRCCDAEVETLPFRLMIGWINLMQLRINRSQNYHNQQQHHQPHHQPHLFHQQSVFLHHHQQLLRLQTPPQYHP